MRDAPRLEGEQTVTFLPPQGGELVIVVRVTSSPSTELREGNVYCRPLKADGLAGTRCLDTIARTVTTTLTGGDRWFRSIHPLRSPLPVAVYDQVTQSMRVLL